MSNSPISYQILTSFDCSDCDGVSPNRRKASRTELFTKTPPKSGVFGCRRCESIPKIEKAGIHTGLFNYPLPTDQNNPTIFPSSFTSIALAEGTFGNPGIVMMSPQTITTNSAPAASRTSRTFTTCPDGAPRSCGSVEKEYCVFATQRG